MVEDSQDYVSLDPSAEDWVKGADREDPEIDVAIEHARSPRFGVKVIWVEPAAPHEKVGPHHLDAVGESD